MAVPPTIPTSFVPRSSTQSFRSSRIDFGGALAFVGFGSLFIAVSVAAAIFAYGWFLSNEEKLKREELHTAEEAIDVATVENFINLHRRLVEGKRILDGHNALSSALSKFEALVPTTIQLTSFDVSFTDKGAGTLSASGIASTFNALAAFSIILGKETLIKNAIFSGNSFQKSGIGFTLTADLEPELLTFTAKSKAVVGATSVTP